MANKLYVGNLSYSTSESALREAFGKHGEIVSVTVIEGKGFGFVEFANEEDAEKARTSLNESTIDGRTIRVDEARPRESRPARGVGNRFRGPSRGRSSRDSGRRGW